MEFTSSFFCYIQDQVVIYVYRQFAAGFVKEGLQGLHQVSDNTTKFTHNVPDCTAVKCHVQIKY